MLTLCAVVPSAMATAAATPAACPVPDTLRNQIDIVDPNFISRDMASGAKQILGLFGQNRTVRNLDGAVIIDKVMVECHAITSSCSCGNAKILRGNDIFAVQTIGATGAQLRRNIIKERVAECNGTKPYADTPTHCAWYHGSPFQSRSHPSGLNSHVQGASC